MLPYVIKEVAKLNHLEALALVKGVLCSVCCYRWTVVTWWYRLFIDSLVVCSAIWSVSTPFYLFQLFVFPTVEEKQTPVDKFVGNHTELLCTENQTLGLVIFLSTKMYRFWEELLKHIKIYFQTKLSQNFVYLVNVSRVK